MKYILIYFLTQLELDLLICRQILVNSHNPHIEHQKK